MSDDARRDIVDQLRADAKHSGLRHVRVAISEIERLRARAKDLECELHYAYYAIHHWFECGSFDFSILRKLARDYIERQCAEEATDE